MRKYLVTLFFVTVIFPFVSYSQGYDTVAKQTSATRQDSLAPKSNKTKEEAFGLKSGFYVKFGPTFPMGNYATTQVCIDTNYHPKSIYYPAKIGAALDLGFMIYIGPAFANNHIRAGIDATFLSFTFNSIKSDTTPTPKTQYWYYYGGQKFGPVISIRPVERLVIDLSYKMNAYVAYLHHYIHGKYDDEWGKNITQNEVSMNIRYSFMLIAFQYNWGQTQYNDFDKYKPTHYVDNNTFRFLVGFKF